MHDQAFVYLPVVGVIATLLALIGLLLKAGQLLPKEEAPLRARRILTANETEFLGRLRRALPEYEVLSQVSLGALLELGLPQAHPQFWALRRRFGMKVVDFVVCRKNTLEVLAVVELDDRTHDTKRAKDAERDDILACAGIPTLRWDSRRKPTPREIASAAERLVHRRD